MKYKRLLASMLCGLMVFPNTGVQVFADTDATTSTFTATADMIGSDLIVTIPDSVPLSKSEDNFVGNGTVTAYGTTNPKSVLTVWTNPTITYENQYKTDITVDATVDFGTDCTAQWTASELKDNITADPKLGYEVTATVPFEDIDYIGEYKTNILFNIELSSSDAITTYYMGYDYTDSTSVNYANQNDIAYDILPQADTVAELKEFSTDREAIEAKGYDKVIESSDESLVIPSSLEGYEVVGVSFDTFFANEDIATYVSDVEVPSSVTGVELSDTTTSASTTVITCENVRTAVNLSKKLPTAAKIRFKFESNGERDYTEFFTYDSDSRGTYIKGFTEYGYNMLKSYGADATVEINLPVTYQGKEVVGIQIVGYADDFSESLIDETMPDQIWILPESYTFCDGFFNNSTFNESNPCTKLTGIVFNEGLTSIEADAFRDCTNLTTVVIPASVTRIGSYAFYGCTNLTNVFFTEGFNGTIEDNAFANTGITEVTLPSSLTSLNGYAFGNDESSVDGNLNVKKVTWGINHDIPTVNNPSGVLYTLFVFNDGNYIGAGSDAVPAIAQPTDGVNALITTDIPEKGFYNNEGKTYENIIIAEGVTSIGASAFKKCTAKTITLPSTIITIGKEAFMSSHANFGTIDLRNVTIGENAFYETTIDTLIVNNSAITKKSLSNATIKNLYIDYTDSSYSLVSYVTKDTVVENVYFSGTEEEYEAFLGSASNNALITNKDSMNIVYNATMP